MAYPRFITADWLRRHGCCDDGLLEFSALFGDRAELTAANLYLAAERGMELCWLAEKLLTPADRDEFFSACGDDPDWDEFCRLNAAVLRDEVEFKAVQASINKALRRFHEASEARNRGYASVLISILGLEGPRP